MSRIELLAPAGSMEALTAALRCGADAVYAGAEQFSARANAENFDAQGLAEAARRCHLYGAKLYLAVNTLIFDAELSALDALLQTAADIGADGCIVQDPGAAKYIAQRLPTLRLHASTQMTIHSPAGVRFAKQAGFCRIVAARELSGKQLAAVCAEAARCGMEVEAFVHGAHCMSVSGQCWMSAAMGGRSANRGCCAQPCRLPFTADPAQKDACALSLKDMSLVAHLSEMTALGVTSLKIEGRMKRPEYVAAAVTACRAALSGRQPDLHELRAVFSRSGFTDGYFTGIRKDMFGTRQKEDVTAAQDVLQQLREKYRKPRKCAVLHAHYTLLPERPAELTVTDDAGHSVTVTGEIPQTAQNRPADLPMLQKQFDKLGDTVYTAGKVTAETGGMLMLPASALNAMRRNAAEQMDAVRIRSNTPEHRLQAPLSLPAQREKHGDMKFRIQIRHMEQIAGLADFADEIDALLLPLQLAERYLAGAQPVPVSRCFLVPPRFYCDEDTVSCMLNDAQARGFSHIVCQHAADVQLGKEHGMTLHGGLGLHITNSHAAAFYEAAGLTDALCSPEAPAMPAGSLPLGRMIYGRLPLMLTRNCPVQAQVGCAKCRHQLTDRKGAAVYTDCTRITEKPDYAELFNAAPFWLADQPQKFADAAFGLLLLTDESAARTREVLAACLRGTPAPPPPRFTRGLRIAVSTPEQN
ncbi:MAG: U32 family peptidase [Oscillospiraceae bacterium]|nr:U32 family peptidase [Oscillospiraceae bacterium]